MIDTFWNKRHIVAHVELGSSLRGQQLLSPLCVPCASPPSSLNLGAFWWGPPPVTVVPHLNSEIAHFLYGVCKKSTHHHQTVGLSCTQLTHSPATTHWVPGEYHMRARASRRLRPRQFFIFPQLQGPTGAHPLKKTTIVISFSGAIRGSPRRTGPGEYEESSRLGAQ